MCVRATQETARRGFPPSALGGVRAGNQANSQGLLGVLQANKGGEMLQAERLKGAWCIFEIASSSVTKMNGEVRVSCVVSLEGREESGIRENV